MSHKMDRLVTRFFGNSFTFHSSVHQRWFDLRVAPRVILTLYGFFCIAILPANQSVAQAGGCSGSRIATSGRSPEVAALSRQLAALTSLQRQRKCKGDSVGGFFNACADIANRRAEVQRRLVSASLPKGGGAHARTRDQGCVKEKVASLTPPRVPADVKRARKAKPGGQGRDSRNMLYCVRIGDGYRFPAPHSQFDGEEDLTTTLDMCRFICDEEAMEVYTLRDPNLETTEMVSVVSRTKYADLPTANAYQGSSTFKPCDLQRYYDRVEEAHARTVTPHNMANANITVPTPKPTMAAVPQPLVGTVALTDAEEPRAPAGHKKVRVVGPSFFPSH